MKKLLILAMPLLFLVLACEDDEYNTPYGDYSSFESFSTQDAETSDYVVALNQFIGFIDVSNNAVEHVWSIPEGTSLLNKEFTELDSVYTEFISAKGPLNLNENIVNVLFEAPGVQEVILKNRFNDSVPNSTQATDGLWEISKTYTVTVFDDLKPSFKVLKGTEEVLSIAGTDMPSDDSSTWPTVTIEAGEALTFVDLTTVGEPDRRVWSFNGGRIETSNSEMADVSYFGLGTFEAGSIKSIRSQSDEKPSGEAIKTIPLNIEVVKSSQPFVIFGKAASNADDVLSFSLSGEIGSAIDQNDKFKVRVVNADAGFDQEIAVTSVAVSSSDATTLELTLAEPIYNSDVVTISYNGGAVEENRVLSVDERSLEDFADVNVKMFFEGIMNIDGYTGYETPWGGSGNQFKKANTEGYWGQHNSNNEGGPLYYFRDESKKRFGNSSMKFETSDTGIPSLARLQGSQFGNLSPVTAGNYIPSVWVYIDASNTMSTIQYSFSGAGVALNFDISSVPKEEWVQLQLPQMDFGNIDSGRLDINITNTDQSDAKVQKLWLDNFDLLIVEPRP